MERYEYGTWKVEDKCIILPNRKFRMETVTSVYLKTSDIVANSCSLIIKKRYDEYELLDEYELFAPYDELLSIGSQIASEAQIEIEFFSGIKVQQEKQITKEKVYLNHQPELEKSNNRAESKKQLEDMISLNKGIKKNQVAEKLEKTAEKIENIGEGAFVIILLLSLIALIVSIFVITNKDDVYFSTLIFPTILTSVVTIGVAFFEMFVYKCVALLFRAQAEMVQNTYISANVALYSANTNNK